MRNRGFFWFFEFISNFIGVLLWCVCWNLSFLIFANKIFFCSDKSTTRETGESFPPSPLLHVVEFEQNTVPSTPPRSNHGVFKRSYSSPADLNLQVRKNDKKRRKKTTPSPSSTIEEEDEPRRTFHHGVDVLALKRELLSIKACG